MKLRRAGFDFDQMLKKLIYFLFLLPHRAATDRAIMLRTHPLFQPTRDGKAIHLRSERISIVDRVLLKFRHFQKALPQSGQSSRLLGFQPTEVEEFI